MRLLLIKGFTNNCTCSNFCLTTTMRVAWCQIKVVFSIPYFLLLTQDFSVVVTNNVFIVLFICRGCRLSTSYKMHFDEYECDPNQHYFLGGVANISDMSTKQTGKHTEQIPPYLPSVTLLYELSLLEPEYTIWEGRWCLYKNVHFRIRFRLL